MNKNWPYHLISIVCGTALGVSAASAYLHLTQGEDILGIEGWEAIPAWSSFWLLAFAAMQKRNVVLLISLAWLTFGIIGLIVAQLITGDAEILDVLRNIAVQPLWMGIVGLLAYFAPKE